ncbi:MAG TPA: FGGY-family carbohydrate kinase [Spirochaetia bacterium]|nr:FGGY-family carbohydrate kinase [Spirochaetia bacterium]
MSILVIDCGTSACRAVRYPLNGGAATGQKREPIPASLFDRGGAEIDLDRLWPLVLRLLQWGSAEGAVEAVGISTFFAYVFLDSDGRLLGPAVTWMDNRAEPEAGTIRSIISDRAIHEATGRVPTAELLIPRLMHIRHETPNLFDSISSVIGLKDELVRRLTGQTGTDYAHADYSLGYLAGTADRFAEIWETVGISSSLLPRPESAASRAGSVTRAAASITGLREGTPVVRGATDGTTAMYGCGVLGGVHHKRAAALVCGTTDVLMAHVPARETDSVAKTMRDLRITCNTAMAGGGVLAGGAMGMSGGTVAWIAELLRMPVEALEAEAAGITGGGESPVMVPSLSGERAPFWNAAVAGTFIGLRPYHRAGHLFRACLEGSAIRVGIMAGILEEAGVPMHAIQAGGGSSGSTLWNRIRADACALTILPLEDPEATARGTALFCAAMLSDSVEALVPLTRDWIRFGPPIEPDESESAHYLAAGERYRSVIEMYSAWSKGKFGGEQ